MVGGSGGMEKDNYGFWAIAIRTMERGKILKLLTELDARKHIPTFECELPDDIESDAKPVSTLHFRCTKEAMQEICYGLKSSGVELL